MSIILAIGRDLGITTGKQNSAFHKRAMLPGAGSGPKDTTGGKDTSKNATNSMGMHPTTMPISPNANANSRNKGGM